LYIPGIAPSTTAHESHFVISSILLLWEHT